MKGGKYWTAKGRHYSEIKHPHYLLARCRLVVVLALASGLVIAPTTGYNQYFNYDMPDSFPHDIPLDVNYVSICCARFDVVDYIEPFPELSVLKIIATGISEIPDLSNVSAVLQELILPYNKIERVESITPMEQLSKLDLGGNSLTEFPNLTSVSHNLSELELHTNNLATLEGIPMMPVMSSLNLDDNQLTAFPDLKNLSTSLKKLSIQRNSFQRVDNLANFPKLEDLRLGGPHFEVFPDLTDVSSSLEELHVVSSRVNRIDYLPEMSKLRKLDLQDNLFDQFPDLTNVSATLVELNLSDNRIESIGSVPEMKSLRVVNLTGNRLAAFPDLSNVGSTLVRLDLAANNISRVPIDSLLPLVSLSDLDLSKDPLLSLPNLCYMNNTLNIYLSEVSIACDWKIFFTKIQEEAGKLVFPGATPQCTTPALTGFARNLNDLTPLELLKQTDQDSSVVSEASFRRLDTTVWTCPFAVDQVLHNVSAIRCAAICGSRWNCLMYSAEEGQCVLTNDKLGLLQTFAKYGNWYIKL